MPHLLRHGLLICTLLLSPVAFAGTVLENALWRVELDPATLAIRVTPQRATDDTSFQRRSGPCRQPACPQRSAGRLAMG